MITSPEQIVAAVIEQTRAGKIIWKYKDGGYEGTWEDGDDLLLAGALRVASEDGSWGIVLLTADETTMLYPFVAESTKEAEANAENAMRERVLSKLVGQ